MFKNPIDASNACKGILKDVDVLKKGVNMSVGNGTTQNFGSIVGMEMIRYLTWLLLTPARRD